MKKRIITILIILNLITLSFFSFIFINSARYDTPKYSQLEIQSTLSYFQTNYAHQPTREQQIQDIELLYGKLNIYYMDLKAYGKAIPILNIIILANDIPIVYFGRVLAHEAEHLKFEFVEYKVEFRCIIKLWESGIPYLKYQAYIGAMDVLTGRMSQRYDCTNLLVEYYKESNMEDYEELEPLIIEDENGELIANPEYENNNT